ncbi:MAG: citryl-CoA lyase [Burkholderiales bacterium]|nr:citryl-CoA lyase [Burkholderiales bacterium]
MMRSELGYSTRENIYVQGRDLCGEILGHIDLGAMAFLQLTGRMPNPNEARLFNALAITLVEHGITPSAIAARMTYVGAPEALQSAVAAGLCGLGTVFAGTSEGAARLLRQALADPADTRSFEERAEEIVARSVREGWSIPGVGHPIHRPVDPRTVRLFAIAEETGFKGRYVAMMQALHRAFEKHKGRPITLNATGAMGALCCELGLPVEACRGIAVMARAIGLVGHILEEIRSPMSIELWQKVEHDVSVPPAERGKAG